jgi:hypothetical protein
MMNCRRKISFSTETSSERPPAFESKGDLTCRLVPQGFRADEPSERPTSHRKRIQLSKAAFDATGAGFGLILLCVTTWGYVMSLSIKTVNLHQP